MGNVGWTNTFVRIVYPYVSVSISIVLELNCSVCVCVCVFPDCIKEMEEYKPQL